ncbi:2-amino-3,7-dideoxy-D-threo-hept-6-ulosonate synthase [Streptomonospora halophila]|uniref:2-amino-3,7-dideoxy-D-threo-hept-6-ulosonate synthase n=1 Tax=Streptomonospora halophila TaxID=427369 RepID=A0ABP9GQV7_9ACTN
MFADYGFARRMRLNRLARNAIGRMMIVPLDHSVADGPLKTGRTLNSLVGDLSRSSVDAVVLHKGSLRHVDPLWFGSTSLIVHLSASTAHAPDPDAKYLVSSVEEALRVGADAVSVHVNLGSEDEARQVADLAAVAEACDRWNLPLMAMMYPRGPRIADPRDAALVAHSASLAADLGADIVKTVSTATEEEMADIVDDCPIPIVVAGGPRLADDEELVEHVRSVLAAGVAGVALGRSVFHSPDPAATARRIADVVHRGVGLSEIAGV